MKRTRNNRAITLVALVITIIILIILAGISISVLTNTGIFQKAQEAKEKSKKSSENEQLALSEYEASLNKINAEELSIDKANKVLSTEKNVELRDENGNIIVVPAGFKIVVDDTTNNAITVDKGIVVEDGTLNADGTKTETNGSQFVWIPVGNIKKDDGTIVEINLNRYTFDTNGVPTAQDDKEISTGVYSYRELEKSNYKNVVAENIVNFKVSAVANSGYYIGRYEARKNSNGMVTEVGTDNIWYNITQPSAAEQSKKMYNSINQVTSDLINSYAWDTATLFLQNCGNNTKYSIKNSLNTELANAGTNNLKDIDKRDVQCNIYDMASNVWEWTTETAMNAKYSGVTRGGNYQLTTLCVSIRSNDSALNKYNALGFRVILYL